MMAQLVPNQAIGGGQKPQSVLDIMKQLYHEGIYKTERGISGALGVDPSLFDYVSRRPSEFGFEYAPKGKRDYGDALRHMLLSAELERTNPLIAGPLLYGHEFISGVMHGQDPKARQMDLFNNQLGRSIGKTAKSRQEVELQSLLNLPKSMTLDSESSLKPMQIISGR